MARNIVKKASLIGEMGFIKGGGKINWFPGHMASATRAIRDRLKLSDFVIEVRDARIPLSSKNDELQPLLEGKKRVVALNKKDLANPNIMHLLDLVEYKMKEAIRKEPTLLVLVVGVPNVGKSVLINSIHQIASSRFPVQGKRKRATVGPLPGVTQDIAGFKIAHQPSIYVLDTPGVLVPSIPDIETGLKLAAAGSVKDSVVGEERIAQYLLAVLNSRGTPLHWRRFMDVETDRRLDSEDKPDYSLPNLLPKRKTPPSIKSDVVYIEDMVSRVQGALCRTLMEFEGSLEDEGEFGDLIDVQFEALQKALKIPHKTSEGRTMASKKFLTLFRMGKLGPFILDDVPHPAASDCT
ncbi:short integuments 2, mitochondrial-like isoform X2 [Salvia miltiorrhiza]|uniref:short integuments 2, mitochondrial-like isoform X2 n=1 Tax=Salvia miltiorrhiza TaxID=226208 RepID=UPI0025AB8972|nr:short integuments 2, mitochondrial-like isoform X2 [Salvia miltiorrhiza]